MKAPRNTSKEARENPVEALAVSAFEGGIERQEAQGQHELVNSGTLPAEVLHSTRAELESAGVKFGDAVPGDPLFVYVTLPAGWKKVATEHSMWSKLVDDRGRERAGIFYKAAFYDRKAHFSVTRRFNITQDYDREDAEDACVYQVTDCGAVVYICPLIPYPKERGDWKTRSAVREECYAAAKAWLAEHYPNWEDAGAYWE